MHHYVYLLIDTDPQDSRKFYIGVRSSKFRPYEDPYMGSSKSMTKEEKHRCDKLLLEEFPTRKEAVAYEVFLHTKFDVARNPEFYNKAKQTSTGFDTTGMKFVFTESHINNMKAASSKRKSWPKGWNHTEAAKNAISDAKKGIPRTEETKKKLSDKMKALYESGYVHPCIGTTHSESTKQLISSVRIQKGSSKGTKNNRFSPWFITDSEGNTESFYTKTKQEKSIEEGFKPSYFTSLSTVSKGTFPLKKGKYKGYIIGNIS